MKGAENGRGGMARLRATSGVSIPRSEVERRLESDTAADVPDDAPLSLPMGGKLVMRKSGGLKFSSKETLITRDRWVWRGETDATPPRTARLTVQQMASLGELLGRLNLAGLDGRKATASPDAYVYEFAVRYRWRLYRLEAADGKMAPGIAELVKMVQTMAAAEA